MKIQTSELNEIALDWAVAVAAERLKSQIRDEQHRPGTSITDIDFDERGRLMVYVPGQGRTLSVVRRDPYALWAPSRIWDQGGPIIEREKISTWDADGVGCDFPWGAHKTIEHNHRFQQRGPTPLIAAMRCYVASKLGPVVDVPDELLPLAPVIPTAAPRSSKPSR